MNEEAQTYTPTWKNHKRTYCPRCGFYAYKHSSYINGIKPIQRYRCLNKKCMKKTFDERDLK